MSARNVVAALLIVVSFLLLWPGLTRDLVTLNASLNFMGNTIDLFEDTRSILKTIDGLHDSGNDFVAGLILLFSVIVPVVKGLLLLISLGIRRQGLRYRLFVFVRSISKWSMADVFVVGVYVAYLSAKATDNLDATIGVGFYWFASYCLVSLIALQFMHIDPPVAPSTSGAPSASSQESVPGSASGSASESPDRANG